MPAFKAQFLHDFLLWESWRICCWVSAIVHSTAIDDILTSVSIPTMSNCRCSIHTYVDIRDLRPLVYWVSVYLFYPIAVASERQIKDRDQKSSKPKDTGLESSYRFTSCISWSVSRSFFFCFTGWNGQVYWSFGWRLLCLRGSFYLVHFEAFAASHNRNLLSIFLLSKVSLNIKSQFQVLLSNPISNFNV